MSDTSREAVGALTELFVAAFNARGLGRLLPTFATDIRLLSDAADVDPLEGRVAVGMHFRRHLEELREADPVNVVATRGAIAFRGVDDHPCAIVFDGRLPSSLICLEVAPPGPGAARENGPGGEITAIHVLRDPATVAAASAAEPPRFREPMDHPGVEA